MTVELRHLRYAIAASEHGSFRRAARALSVRESTISRRIRDLEDEVGATLFIRDRSGVQLTYAGEQLVRRARKAVNQVSYATKEVGAIGEGEDGVVRIGLVSPLGSGFLAALFQSYEADHQKVRLDFIEADADRHIAAIRQSRLDVAFLRGRSPVEDCDIAHLWNEHVYVAMSEKDPLAVRKAIAWTDLRGRRFIVSEQPPGPEIHDCLVRHLGDRGHHPSIQRQEVYRDTLMNMIATGRSLTLASEVTVVMGFPGVVFRPLEGEILAFCAVWSPKNDNPPFRRLLSLAKKLSDLHPPSSVTNGRTAPLA
jgi:DNA-binding transcriptional LysR family regulator